VQDTTNNFLKKYLKQKPGKIINAEGKVLGQHNGLWFYTIGQRRGLEIQQGPWFVVGKDFRKNILVISKNQKDLLKKELVAKNVNWISGRYPNFRNRGNQSITSSGMRVEVKIRYKSEFSSALIRSPASPVGGNKGGGVKIVFKKLQKAITPGQSAVFYQGEELLGGGVIQ
jgi:tRNA-specific 2-thiouridylase